MKRFDLLSVDCRHIANI
jgi:pimeloyl-ACP methyl ester carboxylesterase